MANIKAQASRLFNGVKEMPVAKGIKDVLYVDNLYKNSQSKVLKSISEKAGDANVALDTFASAIGPEATKIGKDNVTLVDKLGLEAIDDPKLKEFLGNRVKGNDKLKQEQNDAIMRVARNKASQSKALDEASAKSLIVESAKAVDGQLTFMSPVGAAMEYYGAPISGAIGNIQGGNYTDALKQAGVFGARAGATSLAVAGVATAVNGVTNGVKSGINMIRGNSYERE